MPAEIEEELAASFELVDAPSGADGIVTTPAVNVDDAFLDAAGPRLRIVANYAVGLDNIDFDATRARGIVVSNTPGVLTNATAEHAIALILAALVTGEPHIRFYAGFPLVTSDGFALGSLCAIDRHPRRLNEAQTNAMKSLARQVMALLELRRASTRLAELLENVRTLHGLLPICAWCKRIRDDEGYWEQVEAYIRDRTDATFTHGICPDCLEKEIATKEG